MLHRPTPVWTATLLYVLEGVGIAEKAARQAIMRAAGSGWIENSRDGRRTRWALTDQGRALIGAGSTRLKSLRRPEWNGQWLILHLPLPETQRSGRVRAYRALSWLGFGSPATALWINPHSDRQPETLALLAELQPDMPTNAFVGHSMRRGDTDRQMAERAWDMSSVLAHYRELTATFGKMHPRSTDDCLFAHVRLVNQLQRLPFIDPGLPAELLPPGCDTGEHADKLFAIRRSWREAAHARWRELAERPPDR